MNHTLRKSASDFLNLEDGEGATFSLFFLHAFLNGVALTFVFATAYTMFLATFGAENLPFIYIIGAFIGTAVSTVLMRVQERLGFRGYLTSILGFVGTVALLLFGGLAIAGEVEWLVFSLPVWAGIFGSLFSTEFGALAGRSFDLRQSKRLMGLIRSGQFFGQMLAGLMVGVLVPFITLPGLLCVAGAVVVGIGLVVSGIFKQLSARLGDAAPKRASNAKAKAAADQNVTWKSMLSGSRYVVLIFFCYLCWNLAKYAVDNAYYMQLAQQFPVKADMADFIGKFSAAAGLATLTTLMFISAWLLRRFGILIGLLILPVALFAVAASVSILDGLGAAGTVVFVLVVAMQLARNVLAPGVFNNTVSTLFQVLPARQRMWTTSTLYGLLEPIAGGLAGLMLLLFLRVFEFDAANLALALLAILTPWIAATFFLHREYSGTLRAALSFRRFGAEGEEVAYDAEMVATLEKGLHSQHPGEVLYCLSTLHRISYEGLSDALGTLLNHPAPEVRTEALKVIEERQFVELSDAVRRLAEKDDSPKVRETAVEVIASFQEDDCFEYLTPFIDDEDASVRRGAMVGLLRHGGIDGALAVGARLKELIEHPEPRQNIQAAEILGEVRITNFYRPVQQLLNSEHEEVRRAALRCAGILQNPRLLPRLIDLLAEPNARQSAASALVRYGPAATEALVEAYRPQEAPSVTLRVVKILGQISDAKSLAFLAEKMFEPDPMLRHEVLRALTAGRYRATGERRKAVLAEVDREFDELTHLLIHEQSLEDTEEMQVLRRALVHEFEESRSRILLLLATVFDADVVLKAKKNLAHRDSDLRAFALEALDNLLPQDIKKFLLPVVDYSLTNAQRLEKLRGEEGLDPTTDSVRAVLQQRGERQSQWLQVAALHTVGVLGKARSDLANLVKECFHSQVPVVRETAAWALFHCDHEAFAAMTDELRNDASPLVSKLVAYLSEEKAVSYAP